MSLSLVCHQPPASVLQVIVLQTRYKTINFEDIVSRLNKFPTPEYKVMYCFPGLLISNKTPSQNIRMTVSNIPVAIQYTFNTFQGWQLTFESHQGRKPTSPQMVACLLHHFLVNAPVIVLKVTMIALLTWQKQVMAGPAALHATGRRGFTSSSLMWHMLFHSPQWFWLVSRAPTNDLNCEGLILQFLIA